MAVPSAATTYSSTSKEKGRAGIPAYMKAVSGAVGGMVEAWCVQPIDVIKTRLQLDRVGQYRGIIHCGADIMKSQGVKALWSGLTPFTTHITIKYTFRMGFNAVLQGALSDPFTGSVSNTSRIVAGFGTGVLEALLIVTPLEVIKIRLQQQQGLQMYKGAVHCGTSIVRNEGIVGLWAGAVPTVMRNGINQAAMFTAKNAYDRFLWKKHEGDGQSLRPWQSMISGFLAGMVGPVCTGAFDVVKTRLMAQVRSVNSRQVGYHGLFHALRTIYAQEGFLALWKGLLPRLMKIPPGQAIMWTMADQVIGFYETRILHPAHI